MTTFENGPAHAAVLSLCRAPYWLRVTFDGKQYDALDQLDDEAKPNETIYLYRITAKPSWCHIRAAKGAGGMRVMANYRFVPEQPSDAVLRDNKLWREWVGEQIEDAKRWADMLGD